jgi:ABC-2 type transport system permease protein
MRNLLYKEFRLVISPLFFLTMLFGALLLIPTWVYFMAMMYFLFIAVPQIFVNAKAVNDIGFTVMLPVRKRDVVKARVLSIAVLELLQIASAAIFAALNIALYTNGNAWMIDANIAYLGCVFIMYGIFNVAFFPLFYKNAYKIGWPILVGLIVSFLFAGAVEMLVMFLPAATHILDGNGGEALIRQLPVLVAGIVSFALLTWLACKKSARNFEKVDL